MSFPRVIYAISLILSFTFSTVLLCMLSTYITLTLTFTIPSLYLGLPLFLMFITTATVRFTI